MSCGGVNARTLACNTQIRRWVVALDSSVRYSSASCEKQANRWVVVVWQFLTICCSGVSRVVRKEFPIKQRNCGRRTFVCYPWSYEKALRYVNWCVVFVERLVVIQTVCCDMNGKCAAVFSAPNVVCLITTASCLALFCHLIDVYSSFLSHCCADVLSDYSSSWKEENWVCEIIVLCVFVCLFVCLSHISTCGTAHRRPWNLWCTLHVWRGPSALLAVPCSRS
jgi:hypothetical protein